mmetsp:Transcript_15402/g.36632  ORF Transcript_15402/g.36632 Transcript_15402/m.36632 type:complete len:218 (-) Transcript_15402:1026-1679(-)
MRLSSTSCSIPSQTCIAHFISTRSLAERPSSSRSARTLFSEPIGANSVTSIWRPLESLDTPKRQVSPGRRVRRSNTASSAAASLLCRTRMATSWPRHCEWCMVLELPVPITGPSCSSLKGISSILEEGTVCGGDTCCPGPSADRAVSSSCSSSSEIPLESRQSSVRALLCRRASLRAMQPSAPTLLLLKLSFVSVLLCRRASASAFTPSSPTVFFPR